jgi:hypothetical protein
MPASVRRVGLNVVVRSRSSVPMQKMFDLHVGRSHQFRCCIRAGSRDLDSRSRRTVATTARLRQASIARRMGGAMEGVEIKVNVEGGDVDKALRAFERDGEGSRMVVRFVEDTTVGINVRVSPWCGSSTLERRTVESDMPIAVFTTATSKGAVMAVMIGINPHEGPHTAVALDDSEEQLGELRVRSAVGQVERLVRWATPFEERTWAIEGAGGLGYLLAQQLVAAGERPDVVVRIQGGPRRSDLRGDRCPRQYWGDEVACAAVRNLEDHVVGRDLAELVGGVGALARELSWDGQLRWLGPEKYNAVTTPGSSPSSAWRPWRRRCGHRSSSRTSTRCSPSATRRRDAGRADRRRPRPRRVHDDSGPI